MDNEYLEVNLQLASEIERLRTLIYSLKKENEALKSKLEFFELILNGD